MELTTVETPLVEGAQVLYTDCSRIVSPLLHKEKLSDDLCQMNP